MTLKITVMVVLVVLSGIFSATETAFSTFNRVRMKNLADDSRRAALVMKMSEKYDKLISSVLIGNNIVNIGLASLATVFFMEIFKENGATLSTVITTVVVLIFGEITPKCLAKQSPDGFAMFIAPFIRAIMVVLTPLNLVFSLWLKLLSKIFKPKNDDGITGEELITIVDEAEQDGELNEQESELIRSAIEFDDVEAADILTPRVDLVAVEKDTPVEEIEKIFSETGYSRLPVYDETVDSIIGILHEKDFHKLTKSGKNNIKDIIREPYFVPEKMKISKLLSGLREAKIHIAVVLDEYGGTMGVVTLEDILEELVGEIWDEHDTVVELISENADGSITVSGSAKPEDVYEYFDIEPDNEEELAQTVNGWITELLEDFADEGATVEVDGMKITVTQVESNTVEKVNIEYRKETEK